jgi:hypothetical protein
MHKTPTSQSTRFPMAPGEPVWYPIFRVILTLVFATAIVFFPYTMFLANSEFIDLDGRNFFKGIMYKDMLAANPNLNWLPYVLHTILPILCVFLLFGAVNFKYICVPERTVLENALTRGLSGGRFSS